IYSFGESEGSDARMLECLEAANGTRVRARILGAEVSFALKTPGRHIAMNALAVLLAVAALGGDMERAARALEGIEPLPGRGRRERLDIGDPRNPVVLIDESYNASPAAMRAAFRVLALVDPGRGGRRIAVLGDMYELGPDAARLHAELALPLRAANVELVYTCGPLMKNLHDALPPELRAEHRDDHVEMGRIVPDVLVPGDVVMVKGSRGGGEKPRMQVVVEALRAKGRRAVSQATVSG
ncbi:MAG TPA: cyanophycin synthetase, partial [Alphaproteobacteria bacterium]|nr:cyanophycin synthetase [Alphaproteobacteria bacterium]